MVCPDTDGDKIPDNKDKCPKEPGSKEMKGCPDTDKDGIADYEDNCPFLKGSINNHGCPEVDAFAKKQIVQAAKLIKFETAKSKLTPSSLDALNTVAKILKNILIMV